MYNLFETLHKLQISTQHLKWKKTPHRTPNVPYQGNMVDGIAPLRTKKLRGTAGDKDISFSNDNGQLNKIPVIVNGFTEHSDTLEVTTVEQINTTENDSDTVIINNINSRGKYSA
jgi:hypothetical protein